MRLTTSGRGEILSFLKGPPSTGVQWNKAVDVSKTYKSRSTNSGVSVQQVSYELSGLDGYLSDPIVFEAGGKRYKFKDVVPLNNDEAIAGELVIEQL